jgi:hypothetical protein
LTSSSHLLPNFFKTEEQRKRPLCPMHSQWIMCGFMTWWKRRVEETRTDERLAQHVEIRV